jgi:UDP-N-acetylmuramyl pentapeptide phosphotransferase/UDP-N-acetylglucosamine-1-phosphate transferase
MNPLRAGFLFLSAILTYEATKRSIRYSLRRGILDRPNSRSSHTAPVPRVGGIGIVAGFCLSLSVAYLAGGWKPAGEYAVPLSSSIFLTGLSIGMAAIGLCDDLRGLSPGVKFGCQLPIAALAVADGIALQSVSLPFVQPVLLGAVALPCTAIWLIGFSNIFNFMDGINGLAAGTGAVYGAFFFLFAWQQGTPEVAVVAILLAGSSLGFLFHNFPRPRTFMGDSGSLFLGMMIALLVVRLSQESAKPEAGPALLLICSVYLYDSGFTLLRRLCRRENIFQAHRSHLYQRLIQTGLSHAQVTALYLVLHSIVGCLALLYMGASEILRLQIVSLVGFLFLALTWGVGRAEQRSGI